MNTITKLSIGDLYCVKAYEEMNIVVIIWDDSFRRISNIDQGKVILLVDNRYYHTVYDFEQQHQQHYCNLFGDTFYFEPCKDLKEAKHYDSISEAYVKIAYNNIVGYVNAEYLELVEKQS